MFKCTEVNTAGVSDHSAVRAEEEHEDSPAHTAATPRSKRKSAQLVSSRIRKQL